MNENAARIIVKVYAIFSWVWAFVLFILGLIAIYLTPAVVRIALVKASPEELAALAIPSDMLLEIASAIGTVLGIIILLLAIVYALIGFGLLSYKSWAKNGILAVSIPSLLSFPLGTLIGGFAIYAFGFEEEVKKLFEPKVVKIEKVEKKKK
jgi:hypothetical protein